MAITIIEDRDPIIVYKGSWTAGGNKFESNGTTMVTNEAGATTTIEFVGRNISVFGTVRVLSQGQASTVATFTLDDGTAFPATTFTAQHSANTTQYYIPMFRSPPLTENRSHKLVMTHHSAPGGQLTLDYMTVQGALTRYAPIENGMSSTAKLAIVGGVLGGVIFVLLGLIAALVLKQGKGAGKRSVFTSEGKGLEHTGFLGYRDQSPMNTGSQRGISMSDTHTRSLATSPALTTKTGLTSNGPPYRPPLPEMEES
ncbi:hypothetical protein D9611_009643 [Ephemerocybe angulata]|uniref:Uncharacterized protein n=1 Tax=Ephemerocybe angulata TaxID=980116 RepID=A0A8H5C7U8_9AGAR|nr:hypothetical protein D9611_009643 [Tulosesus angulatus]